MGSTRRHLLVAALSLGLLLLMVLLVAISNLFDAERPQTLTFREVVLASPPPPPPPPVDASPDASTAAVDLSASNPQASVLLLDIDLQVDLPKGQLLTNGSGNWGTGDGLGLEIDWSAFSLAELDGNPLVMQAPEFNYPRSLAARGVRKMPVRLHILIDEAGKAYLVQVLETPDASFNADIDAFVQGVRFTPPTIDGVVVKAEFVWPVEFSAP